MGFLPRTPASISVIPFLRNENIIWLTLPNLGVLTKQIETMSEPLPHPAPVLPRAALPSIDETFGAVLIGSFIGLMLYGLTVHQTFRYFCMYPGDARFLKATVFLLFLTDTLHTVVCFHINYHYLVVNYFNPFGLLSGVWSIRPSACHDRDVTLLRWRRFTWIISGIFGSAVATDIMLTTTLIIYLRSNRTGYKQTDSMLNIMTVYTINTGLLTSTLSFFGFIFALVQPATLVYAAVSIPATKSYAISVLSVLNSRSILRDVIGSPRLDDFGAFGMRALLSATRPMVSQQSHRLDGNVQGPAIWDGNPSTVIDIKTHSSGSQTVGLQQPPGAEESSSREAIDSFEMKNLRSV
ncbi:hypothetical protein C8Q74DRAFT_1366942 [Fomes fomentarius]|nr:hypothetical protein C8Q74DRAFT_1366942 [Fomes fomentarius]